MPGCSPYMFPKWSMELFRVTLSAPRRKKKFFFFFCFLEPHLWHMEVPRLGVESELLLPAYITATATWDPSCIVNLHHSSRQRWIPDPLIKARDWTCILKDSSQIHFHCTTTGTPRRKILNVGVGVPLRGRWDISAPNSPLGFRWRKTLPLLIWGFQSYSKTMKQTGDGEETVEKPRWPRSNIHAIKLHPIDESKTI